MINVFYKNRNTIGQFMVALMFLGTFGFLFTYDGFVSKSQASSCCGGGEAAAASFAADSSGDYGSDIPMDAEPTGGCGSGTDNGPNSSNESSGSGDCNCLTHGYEGQYTCSDDVCSSANICGGFISSCNKEKDACCEGNTGDCGCTAVCKNDGSPSTMCDANSAFCEN